MMGSRISAISLTTGSFAGLSMASIAPLVRRISYTTGGELIFALEPLLHYVHVQKAEKPAAKAEPQGARHLQLIMQRRVVQAQLGEGVAKFLIVVGIHRKQAREHARLDLLETGQRQRARAMLEGD